MIVVQYGTLRIMIVRAGAVTQIHTYVHTSPGLIVALDIDNQSTRNGDQLHLANTAVGEGGGGGGMPPVQQNEC